MDVGSTNGLLYFGQSNGVTKHAVRFRKGICYAQDIASGIRGAANERRGRNRVGNATDDVRFWNAQLFTNHFPAEPLHIGAANDIGRDDLEPIGEASGHVGRARLVRMNACQIDSI